MIWYLLPLYAVLAIGWDTWAWVAFIPWDDFTRQGLGTVLALRHAPLAVSFVLLCSSALVQWRAPRRTIIYRMQLLILFMALGSALALYLPGFHVDGGFGGFCYLFGVLLLIGRQLAQLGWFQSDPFFAGATVVLWALLLLFIGYPLATIGLSAIRTDSGLQWLHWFTLLQRYGSLSAVAGNTCLLAGLVAITTTTLATILALVCTRSRFVRLRGVIAGCTMVPMLTPPFVIGLALIYLFGRAGFITSGLFGWNSAGLFGLPGLILTQTLSFTPAAFLIVQSVLQGVDATLEEASFTLRGNYWHTFRRVTWPLLRPGIVNALLLTVMESFADFANPVVIGGNFRVLSTEIYAAVIGRYDTPLAASLSLVLLASTIVLFLLQYWWLGDRSYVTVTGKPQARVLPGLPPLLDGVLTGIGVLVTAFALGLYLFFFFGGFVQLWGIDHTLTLAHYRAFWHDAADSLWTTLWIAAVAAPVTAGVGLLLAYITHRREFRGQRPLELLALLGFAVPGTIIGLGYLMAFQGQPVSLTGTSVILLCCFIFRNMPVGMRAGVAVLSQIDRSLEEASLTLGARTWYTLRRVLTPLAQGAILTAFSTSFVRAITAISAVVFLVSAQYNLATKVILDRIEYGALGVATAYCTVLVVIMGVVVAITHWWTHRPGTTKPLLRHAAQ